MSEALKFTVQTNRSMDNSPPVIAALDQPQLLYVLIELLNPASSSPPFREGLGVGMDPQVGFPREMRSHDLRLRLPLNFALVLDQSGSMAGEKLATMKEAVKNLIDQLAPDDRLAIVAFSSKTQLIAPAQAIRVADPDKQVLKRDVDRLKDGGGTSLAPALQEGLRQVVSGQAENRVSRIVLLTDGEATDRLEDSRLVADQAGLKGIPIIALGLGQDWKEEFLFELADRSLLAPPGSRVGQADYIPAPQDVARIFQEVYTSMQVIAQDVTVTLRMVQGLEARRAWQAAPLIRDVSEQAIQGRAVILPVGQLDESGVAFLLELMLPPRPAGIVRIAQAEATFTTPGAGAQRLSADLLVAYSADPAAVEPVNRRVMDIVEKVQAFKLQTQALEEARLGNASGATRKLRQAVTILLAQGESELADKMEREANRLEQTGQLSSEGKKTIMLTSRKTIRLQEKQQ